MLGVPRQSLQSWLGGPVAFSSGDPRVRGGEPFLARGRCLLAARAAGACSGARTAPRRVTRGGRQYQEYASKNAHKIMNIH